MKSYAPSIVFALWQCRCQATSYARPGTVVEVEVTVEDRRQRALATVVNKPFFDPFWKKN